MDVRRIVIIWVQLKSPALSDPTSGDLGPHEAIGAVGDAPVDGIVERDTDDRLESKQDMLGGEEALGSGLVPLPARRDLDRPVMVVAPQRIAGMPAQDRPPLGLVAVSSRDYRT